MAILTNEPDLPRLSDAKKALIFESMQDLWARLPLVADSREIIEADRNR